MPEINDLANQEKLIKSLLEQSYEYLPSIALGIVTLIVGIYLANSITKFFANTLEKKEVDQALRSFLTSLLRIFLKLIVFISVLGIMGVQTTSFIAVLGSAGLAVGLALQGSLSNFAGGVLIIILKPFKAGDYIEAQGLAGTVDAIHIFTTRLKTPDNKVIYIPNGPLANGNVTNYSQEDTRRVDWIFGIGYGDDLKKAKEIILNTIQNDSRVLQDPAPFIAVHALADSSVNFVVRIWCQRADYWGIYFDGLENVKLALDENGISIPFPQRDVHLIKDGE